MDRGWGSVLTGGFDVLGQFEGWFFDSPLSLQVLAFL